MIELREVGRRYLLGQTEVHALEGVSLSIQAGEYVAIIGQSGSGKSTLMNVLGCLDTPSSGQFLIDWQDAAGLGPDELAGTDVLPTWFRHARGSSAPKPCSPAWAWVIACTTSPMSSRAASSSACPSRVR